jgi:hypothetical protein
MVKASEREAGTMGEKIKENYTLLPQAGTQCSGALEDHGIYHAIEAVHSACPPL